MQKQLTKGIMFLIAMCMIGSAAACSGEPANKTKSDNHKAEEKPIEDRQELTKLQQYSSDPDIKKGKDEDFDLIGTLKKDAEKEITLNIDDQLVKVPKSSGMEVEGSQLKDMINKEVEAEIDAAKQEATSIELTPKAKADKNGVYEQDGDERKIVGVFIEESNKHITVKVPNGKKTYQKSTDFEKEEKGSLKEKTVYLEINSANEVESIEKEDRE
ncbi:hypothetical protein ABEY50_14315 [Priestia megaterium]|uniref:hypothetical protein n=1 Tax=Priestia megaterium TaxID=1404 RepID=UPI000BF33243|nr:hypothetical protein [Priestia megaterium]MEB2293201.1 hypothetical protein [Priestia megaterium]PEZ09886.1 hypothetical protein CN330_21245 [Priestia megaterium]PGK30448.1 hypothetical protein CN902_11570 [Priestia megaterium]WRQ90650.1 hypothetical protein NQ126_014635 [Priestia megaterium]